MFGFRSHTVSSLSSIFKNVHKTTQAISLRLVTSSTSGSTPPKWQLLSALCLERTPIITPPMTKMETEMSQMIENLDTQKSLKSDHELRQEEDRKRVKNTLDGNQEDNNPEAASRQTAQDFEDACNEEFSKFKPAPRLTDEDLKGDKKSSNRKLDRHLLFVVREKVGDKEVWSLPQAPWKDGETLRQTAERALKNYIKIPDTTIRVLGNAPWGVHTIKYPASIREKMGYNVSGTEYNWLGREELDCMDKEYLRSVKRFLVDED